jgi:hypothetical protein
MKRAPWVALAAIAMFLAAIASSHRIARPEQVVALDFTDIDTLVVNASASIVLQPASEATRLLQEYHYHAPDVPRETPRVTRQGTTLTIHAAATAAGYLRTKVHAPATLRRIVVAGGDIEATSPVDALEIETTGALSWNGRAKSLRILDRTRDSGGCAGCDHSLRIADGTIGTLVVRTRSGNVVMAQAERLGDVRLELGEEAEYELGSLHGNPPQVTVVAYPAEAAAPLIAPLGNEAASPPTEPPRRP